MTKYSAYSDQELSTLVRGGDRIAYTEIYHRYSGLLYVFAYNKLRSRDEAKDILQELFTAIWNGRMEMEFKTSLSGYLYTSITNKIIKLIAHQKVQNNYINSIKNSLAVQTDITDHLLRENQLRALIEKEVDALPDKMREIFLLSRKANLSHKEIAGQLGIAETTVKKQVSNAVKILRVKLGIFAYLVFLIKF